MRGDGTVYRCKGSACWWVQYYVAGKRIRESSHSSDEKIARKLLRTRLTQKDSGDLQIATSIHFSSLYESIERDYLINSRKDLATVKSRWSRHLRDFFADRTVQQVTAETLSLYISRRQLEKASNATINRELALIKRMYKLAVKSGRLKVGQQPYVEMLKERNVRKGFLKDEEYEALARATAKEGLWLRAMFEVAYTYGWRKSELLGLLVGQVDLKQRCILLNPGETKNDMGRSAPLTDRALELVKSCMDGKSQSHYLFTRQKDARGRTPRTAYIHDFRKAWGRAIASAGLPGLLFHDLRRTGVRNMRRHGISEKVAMTISGHRTRSVFERYNIVDSADLFDAGNKLNQAAKDRDQMIMYAQRDIAFPQDGKPN